MRAVCIVLLVAALAVAASAFVVHPKDAADMLKFVSWKNQFSRVYSSDEEETTRFRNFQSTLQRITTLSARNPQATFAVNKFSDLSAAEFKSQYLTVRPADLPIAADPQPVNLRDSDLPATFDWRSKKAVTAVKDQGQCGSCWAFSVTETVESMAFLAGHKLMELSPQQIVDCDTQDSGCDGGTPDTAYQYLMSAGGQELDSDYPYTSGDSGSGGDCQFDQSKVQVQLTNYSYAIPGCQDSCESQNETDLKVALVATGPLSVCVDAEPWQDYSSGIFSDGCSSSYDDIDHCVQLVGYNANQGYWLVRNSWGESWGESGFIYLQYGQNTCGVADWVTYPGIQPPQDA